MSIQQTAAQLYETDFLHGQSKLCNSLVLDNSHRSMSITKSDAGRLSVKAWRFQDVLLELYRREPGRSEALPPHSHEEYQFTLSLTHTGQYYYRGATHPVPVGSLSAIHPGEMHQTCPSSIRLTPCQFRMMYVPGAMMQQVAVEVAGRSIDLPFFASTLPNRVAAEFLRLHQTLQSNSRLESESQLLLALAHAIRCAENKPPLLALKTARTSVRRVQKYLQENYAENVSLEELAQVADLSSFHLLRVFAKEIGQTPHVYQTQVRIARAKLLLVRGLSPAQVAIAIGFYDQSHFGKHFKRLIGVPPSQYAEHFNTSKRSQ